MFCAGTVGCECANTGMLSLAQHPRRACLAFSSSNVSWHSGITASTSPRPPRPPYLPDAFHTCMLTCLATVLDECPPHSLSPPPCGNGQSTLILKSVPVASFTRHWHAFIYCAGLRFTWLLYPRVRGRDELVLARAFVPAETVVVSGPWLTARVTLANIPRMALSCFAPDHPPCLLFIIPAAATDGVEGYSIAARYQSVLEALSSVYPLCSGEGESNLRSMSLYSAFGVCP